MTTSIKEGAINLKQLPQALLTVLPNDTEAIVINKKKSKEVSLLGSNLQRKKTLRKLPMKWESKMHINSPIE